VELDISGAGDHLDKVDSKVRRIKEPMRSVIAGLPYSLSRDRVKDLVTYAVSRTNVKSMSSLNHGECPRVRFTGMKPDYKSKFGLAFGDYVEDYNPRAQQRSNNIWQKQTEPCIALYPSANRNGSLVIYSLPSKSYVHRMQWKRMPVTQTVINIMNNLAGDSSLTLADTHHDGNVGSEVMIKDQVQHHTTHVPELDAAMIMTPEEAQIDNTEAADLGNIPELVDADEDDDSDSESGDSVELEHELQELDKLLEDSSDSQVANEAEHAPLRRSARTTAGVKRKDDSYDWGFATQEVKRYDDSYESNLMNLSMGTVIRSFGAVTRDACKAELLQLFQEKKALVPVHWDSLNVERQKKA